MQQDMRALGKRGGDATYTRYGKEHMATIGRRGLAVTVERHWNGDRARCLARLAELGRMTGDPFPQNDAWQYRKREGEPW